MNITLELLQAIAPATKSATLENFIIPLQEACDAFEIDTPSRVACFIAQVCHESGGFKFTKENLNYSAPGLRKTFPKYFPTDDIAKQYERNPEMIASRTYGGRMGNGPEETGDGFKYMGRGLIQLTGKNNYSAFAEDSSMELDEAVEFLQTYEGAAYSAGWYWHKNNLNQFADKEDMTTLTKRINGGTIGLEDRMHIFHTAKQYLESE